MKRLVSLFLCVAMLLTVTVVPTNDDGISTSGLINREDVYEPIE